MKKDIHPTMHAVKATCSCGETFDTLSTLEQLNTETCSKCHPFFTGKQKFVDSAQRVEKFQAKMKQTAKISETRKHKTKKEKRAARDEKKTSSKSNAKNALKAAKEALKDL